MPDYKRDKALCSEFLKNFVDESNRTKYLTQLTEIKLRRRQLLEVSLDDVHGFVPVGEETALVESVETNTRRYQALFAGAADDLMQDALFHLPESVFPADVFDVMHAQREARLREQAQSHAAPDTADPQNRLPPELMRRYHVVFIPRSTQKRLKLREVGSKHVGTLVTVQGIVTHMTDVKPLITVATYVEDDTGIEVYQPVIGRSFTPLTEAPVNAANQGGNNKPLMLQTHGSKFVQFQEVKIQEMASEVPQGTTPRAIVVHFRGALTQSCKPGDAVSISGVFLPEPYHGFRAIKAGLLTSTYLDAMGVTQLKQSYQQHAMDKELQARMHAMAGERDIYDRLASSIAPEIFGHEDVKKALLLLMVGGVTKQMPDGMKLRGDIHLCLMGDPGVAKSQLIKHIAHVSPRAVYTTGKGSSGVGLTASVQRDPVTSEMVLEGGALVLADKGICCIDEFDKMEEGDRTAIHEVMEQQTVSIAKAGITTTLNTRTTVLAAANPAWGRYDTRRSPAENIALPAALLSRFDLMWLILDKANPEQDRQLANHVLLVHKEGRAPAAENGQQLLTPELLRGYIATAKTFQPHCPRELAEFIAAVYAEMRGQEAAAKVPHSYTTPRTLLSIMRLSQALARLRFSDAIVELDVKEALRLMRMSKMSLLDDQNSAAAEHPSPLIYAAIRDHHVNTSKRTFLWAELVALLGRTYTNEQIRSAVEEYGDYNVFSLDYPSPEEPTVHIVE